MMLLRSFFLVTTMHGIMSHLARSSDHVTATVKRQCRQHRDISHILWSYM